MAMRRSALSSMKPRSILATSVVALFLTTELLVAAGKPAKPAAPPAEAAAPAPDAAPVAAAPALEIKDPVAVVEGAEIKKADLESALAGVLAQQGKSLTDIPAEQKPGIYRMLLDDLIVERLVAKRSAEVKIPDEDVAKTFDRVKGGRSDAEIKTAIEKSGQTVEGVQKNIRVTLQAQRWVDEQLKGKIEVTDADAEDFYKKNPDQFQMPERVRASHILIKVPPEAKPEEVVAKEKAAEAVIERVKKGEDFAKLADEISEDPNAKENHGDLDFFQKDQMVTEFSEAAFKMKTGDMTPEPVRSEFGYHIIKVTDRKAPETVTLENARPQLIAFLKQQKRDAELQILAKDLRAKADVKINLPGGAQ
jgi:peptidyl-prolyl cis-trans isomerase C